MVPGVAFYPEMEGKPLILIEEQTLQNMDPTAQGKPVYVHHVENVDLGNLEMEMAGVWIRSFFNEADGAHWAEFTVQSDEGHEAVRRGFSLSDSYIPRKQTGPGEYHGMAYKNAVIVGEYEHLALTPTPRYQESAQVGLLTPEEFKAYNEKKLQERAALKNSKGDGKMKFNWFKSVKNEQDISPEDMVELPKSKKTVSVLKLVNEADDKAEKEAKNEYAADLSHKVKLHDGKMCNVGELLEAHKKLNEEHEALLKEHNEIKDKLPKEEGAEQNEGGEGEDKDIIGKAKEIEEHEKAEIEAGEKKKNSLAELEKLYLAKGLEVPSTLLEQKKKGIEHFDALKNAQSIAIKKELEEARLKNAKAAEEIQTVEDRVALGRQVC
jgi:hypothetical protein